MPIWPIRAIPFGSHVPQIFDPLVCRLKVVVEAQRAGQRLLTAAQHGHVRDDPLPRLRLRLSLLRGGLPVGV